MKVEFNDGKFSASMNENNEAYCGNKGYNGFPIKLPRPLALGIIATAISLLSLSLAFFSNMSADILVEAMKINLTRWIILISVISFSFLAASVSLGIWGIIAYTKSAKSKEETVGTVLSVISFAITALSIAVNVMALV